MKLIHPCADFRDSFLKATAEFEKAGQLDHIIWDQHDKKMAFEDFEAYCRDWERVRNGIGLPEGIVPATEWWIIVDDHFVGRINLRHRLNEGLEKYGGHIGYSIRPNERKKGYATQALTLCLEEARKMNLGKVLVTCSDENEASIKTIEKNGGVLQDKLHTDFRNELSRRYWITL